MKFIGFLKNVFITHLPIKLLALALAVIVTVVVNAI